MTNRTPLNQELADKVLEILAKHKVLNIMELCREVNGLGKNNFKICHQGMIFGADRDFKDLCAWKQHNCKTHYGQLYKGKGAVLDKLFRQGTVQTEVRRFYDKSKAVPTDRFRFVFLERSDYERIILRQTLEPYTGE